jgi:hypothetical protein
MDAALENCTREEQQSVIRFLWSSVVDAGKLMLTLFWDMNGPIPEHYQEKGETVNSVR